MASTTFSGPVTSTGGFVGDVTGNVTGDITGDINPDEPINYSQETGITAFATGGQGSATALTKEFNNVTTCATAGDSVALPAAVIGLSITVKNSGAASLAVFPASGDSINALAVNLSVNVAVGSWMTFRAISATVWETQERITLPAPTTQTGEFVIQATDQAGDTQFTLTNASQAQASTWSIPDVGATGTFVALEGAQTLTGAKTFSAAATFSGGLTGDVNGTALTTEQGSGMASITTYSSEITKQGKVITTHIFIDIAGLNSGGTADDIIGDDAGSNCHLGQITVADCGQVFSGSMTCLEAPATGDTDINL